MLIKGLLCAQRHATSFTGTDLFNTALRGRFFYDPLFQGRKLRHQEVAVHTDGEW